eukprot:13955714-Alexandrium_andersonii.AAC.1
MAMAAIAAGSPWGIDPVEVTTSGAVSPANSMTRCTSDHSLWRLRATRRGTPTCLQSSQQMPGLTRSKALA